MPQQRYITAGYYKLEDGVWFKRCNGASHSKPAYFPANSVYFHVRKVGRRKGQLLWQCKKCVNWQGSKIPLDETGFVEVRAVRHFYEEAVNRVGLAEFAKRTGLTERGLAYVLKSESKYVRKTSLKRVMVELYKMRAIDEHSINLRARWHIPRRTNGVAQACKGCGTTLDNRTTGCKHCYERFDRERNAA